MSNTPITDVVLRAPMVNENDTPVSRLYAHARAQEVTLQKAKDALERISTFAHCVAKAGPLNTPDLAAAWGRFMEIDAMATRAISEIRRLTQPAEETTVADVNVIATLVNRPSISGLNAAIEHYFATVSDEQFQKDLKAADFDFFNRIGRVILPAPSESNPANPS